MGCCGATGNFNARNWGIIVFFLGLGVIITAVLIPHLISKMIDSAICDNVCVPSKRSEGDQDYWKYSNWISNENISANPPEYYYFYVYNITNPNNVSAGSKPILNVLGPYTYRYIRRKTRVSFSDDESQVSYETFQQFQFERSLSNGDPTDPIVTVNLPIVSGLWNFANQRLKTVNPSFFALVIASWCKSDKNQTCLFSAQTVENTLFHQFSFAIFSTNTLVFSSSPGFLDINFQLFFNCTDEDECHQKYTKNHMYGMGGKYATIDAYLSKTLIGTYPIPPGYHTINNTLIPTDGNVAFVENTGRTNMDEIAKVYQFMGNSSLNIWNGLENVQGNTHFQFKPNLDENGGDSELLIWEEFLMRQCKLVYNTKTSLYDVEMLRYITSDDVFGGMDPHYFGSNKTGILDLTNVPAVLYGLAAPIFASRPYFAGADASILDSFQCLNCPSITSVQDYESFVDVEPRIGKVLRGQKAGQINVWIGQDFIFNYSSLPYRHVPNLYMPVAWFNYSAAMTSKQADQVKDGLHDISKAQLISKILLFAGTAIGIVLVVVSIGLCLRYKYLKKDEPTSEAFHQIPVQD